MKSIRFEIMCTFLILLLFSPALGQTRQNIVSSHALTVSGTPKYGPNFTHFDYANPKAPKGGHVTLSAVGTFDSFNPFIIKGVAASGVGLIYDTLTVQSLDEPFTRYGLIAEKIELPEDRTWVTYYINPKAKFHDGRPVTSEDVIFSFTLLKEKGDPLYDKYWADVKKVEAQGKLKVKFYLGDKPNPELALILGEIYILPKHYWKTRDFTKPSLEIPMGSGPYTISKFKAGRSITYKRNNDYWAKDLPVNRGHYNFDAVTYDYYRDPSVAIHAFKSGEYDFRTENISKTWATAYTGPSFKKGFVIKEELDNDVNQGMQAFVYNIRRAIFKDRAVREALAYAFDFEWTNKELFYGQYTRSRSYFSNSELASKGRPSPSELKILEPFKSRLPKEVFEKEYQPPKTDGSGNNRTNLREALRLLKQAGWGIKGKKLVNKKDGRPFKFEILLHDPSFERVVLPFRKNLSRLGIEMNIRMVDTAQYINRLRDFDFDMTIFPFGQSESPGNEQREFWGSKAADIPGARNYVGIKDPVVDKLIERLIAAPNREQLVTATRALDRVLLWGHYVIPQWHLPKYRLVYWNKFSRPKIVPHYGLDFNVWWVDEDKNSNLIKYKKKLKKK